MKLAVVTTARSEYSLNRWIINEIRKDTELSLQLLVGGAHLVKSLGDTYQEIEADGIHDYTKIEFAMGSDSPQALAKSVGVAAISVAQLFAGDRPDFLLLNGDRYELLAFVIPAMLFQIPIGHIGGGEITEGVIDDRIRHAITKLSHLHFVACEEYAKNISLLGEEDWRIQVVGAEGLENLYRLPAYTRQEISVKIELDLELPTVLVTYHTSHEDQLTIADQIGLLLKALEKVAGLQMIFTAPGVEVGSEIITQAITDFVALHRETARFFPSLGGRLFISMLRNVKCIVGNSSSGIIEAPAVKIPTVNIGRRQKGRVRAKSVIDVDYNADAIAGWITKLLSDPEYVRQLTAEPSPFGDGMVSQRVIAGIKENLTHPKLLTKKLDFSLNKADWKVFY